MDGKCANGRTHTRFKYSYMCKKQNHIQSIAHTAQTQYRATKKKPKRTLTYYAFTISARAPEEHTKKNRVNVLRLPLCTNANHHRGSHQMVCAVCAARGYLLRIHVRNIMILKTCAPIARTHYARSRVRMCAARALCCR